ncbi:Phenylpyruvate tautomerase PptA, 4-oxalocrotonate tautomerase family [Mycolicibacterium neoaurum]|uniref:Tautomerase enzyme n=2 Tax=Mycolicibacterium neoaurum TaxID=1795 RepID=A0AAV2WQD1_MYCNE|nr:4-oxalocrotonate tautomerase [Mycolicibacterium neoaurum]CDQ46357.1 Tautomerase enzyme [Mycolicibacterium neoaurum]SDC87792.1 Phenylpyruvate tautomerase PptA, 4-oxalocrotonate tautomerase family [Mycolicibacterium neoaurum]
MPLWHIYCPKDVYTADDREEFATTISELYVKYVNLPSFYVSVAFHEMEPGSFFVGGKPNDRFVRIWIDHIARRMPVEQFAPWMQIVNKAISPWVRDRGLDWEIHGDETPLEFWSIQGLVPPPAGSDEEQRWFRDGFASAPLSEP